MSEPLRPIVVVGVGNVLLGDDAIGVRVVEAVRRLQSDDPSALPAGTCLVDGGSLLLDLLHDVRDARGLVLVDAVSLGGPEGSVTVRHDEEISQGTGAGGRVPNSVDELLAVARLMGWLPERTALVGIEVTEVSAGSGLSAAIEAALLPAIGIVRQELRAMDEHLAARHPAAATPLQPTGAQA